MTRSESGDRASSTHSEPARRTLTGTASTAGPSRRRFLTAAGAASVIGLAGCVGGGDDGSGSVSPDDLDVAPGELEVDEINVLAEGVADNLVLAEMSDQFEDEYGVTVNWTDFGYEQTQEEASNQVAADESAYDVMTIDTYWVGDFALGENLLPLDSLIGRSDVVDSDNYLEEVWDTVAHFEGTTWTIPFWQWTLGAGYREDLLQDDEFAAQYESEFGEDLQSGTESVSAYADMTVNITEMTGGDVHGAALMGQSGTKANDQWLGLFQGKGGTFIDEEGNPVYGDYRQEAIEATEDWIRIIHEGSPDGSGSWGFPEVSEHVGRGDGFSAINYNIFYVNMNNALAENTESGQIKQYDTPGGSPAVGSWSLGIPANLSEERAQAAWTYIQWANSFEMRKQRILNGGSPVCYDTLDDDEVVESNPLLWENLEELITGGKSISKYPGALQANTRNGEELSAALAGGKSVEDAIDAGIEAVENAME